MYLADNNLTSVNVKSNTKLEELSLSHNPVAALNLTKNTKLEELYIANTKITKLKLTSNRNLYTLDIRNLKMRTLDLRVQDMYDLDARGTAVKILISNPKLSRLQFQTTIDRGVVFASK